VELYFNSPLPIGENTFTVPNGAVGSNFDSSAGFPLSGTTENFTVNSVSVDPKIQSIISNNTDTIYVEYNRAMDQQTALEPTNYTVNGTILNVDSSCVTFDTGSDDAVVEITNIGNLLKSGKNTVVVNDNIEDTFGNCLSQTSMDFYVVKDDDKPEVSSAVIFDQGTIRIQFNKPVSQSCAVNKENYNILDSNGTDITSKINDIYAITLDGNSNRYFDIKFDKGTLSDSGYILTVKNIIDTNSTPNTMDDYTTTLTSAEDEGVNVTEIVKRSDKPPGFSYIFQQSYG